jgi:hypothetical protein
MSLPLKAIDRLFDRLTATYGREWVSRWEGLDQNAIKTMWSHELAVYANHLEDIAWALEHLPPRAPNVIEFKQLCKSAPRREEVPKLSAPMADPALVNAELEKLRDILKAKPSSTHDPKAWAKRFIARHEAGENVRPLYLQWAREALNIKVAA